MARRVRIEQSASPRSFAGLSDDEVHAMFVAEVRETHRGGAAAAEWGRRVQKSLEERRARLCEKPD